MSAGASLDQSQISLNDNDAPRRTNNSLYAGIAQSSIRVLALYFSRPVRLFRPSKASGWTSLRYAAQRDGATLSPQFISSHIRQHGIGVVPRHFFPPLIINTVLGTLLFTSYTTINSSISKHNPDASTTLVAGISGASAGAIQAIAGAPAENVRVLMESGAIHSTSVSGWRYAWREVFLRTRDGGASTFSSALSNGNGGAHSTPLKLSDIREAKLFVRELRAMCGRGWDGWGWGCAKDVCGYAIFFAIFDVSRRMAITTSHAIESMIIRQPWTLASIRDPQYKEKTHNRMESAGSTSQRRNVIKTPTVARVAQGFVLVAGGVTAGVAYDFVGRPFDVVRHQWSIQSPRLSFFVPVHTSTPTPTSTPTTSPTISSMHSKPPTNRQIATPPLPALVRSIYARGGLKAFFASTPFTIAPTIESAEDLIGQSSPKSWTTRMYPFLRTLGRVGPWGVGFLVWEAYGPGIE